MLGKEHAEHTLQCPDFVSTGLQNHEESYFACSFEMEEIHVGLLWKLITFQKPPQVKKLKLKQ